MVGRCDSRNVGIFGLMTLRPGIQTVGPGNGALRVNTYREGMAQKVGHDLIIEVGKWQAKVEIDEGGTPAEVALEADPHSLQALEGRRGVKPLTDKDRAEIRSTIDEKILHGQPIVFSSNGWSSPSAGFERRASSPWRAAHSRRPSNSSSPRMGA